ncbi:hypothetical protein [Planococcus sp. YIM B11945]|uniref:hypothetical protein n=1 Tax=Planococcus sp. YIM B11945 TaxID=3435410 RepID=UPI003D7DD36E
MDKLIKDLRANLLSNLDVSIRHEAHWQLPVQEYDVTFGRVKRFKMDILMKMLLLAFQETDIRRAANLADMLFVEELFVRDLIEKMERTGLIYLEKKGYKLTAKGYDYLEKGIFEEDMDAEQTLISYSAAHDEYLLAKADEQPDIEESVPLYRYGVEGEADWDRMAELLAKEELGSAEDNFQVLVTDVVDCEEIETRYVRCIEFQLYDQKQDIFFARVWNTLFQKWDETLEKQIEEHEVVAWREAMLS